MIDIQSTQNLDKIKEFIEKCWHLESIVRPTMQDVLTKLKSFYGYNEFENEVEFPKSYDILKVKDLIMQLPNTINRIPWQDIIDILQEKVLS